MPEPRETHTAIDARRNAQRGGGERDALAEVADILPVHTFDCDRFEIYDYGARQGTCDCNATEVVEALAATVKRVRALAEEGYANRNRDPRGPFAGFLRDLRAALAPSDPATDTGGEGRAT